ncbi:MAG TPA: GNAT family N-acetyltransferase [Hyphomicrobiaceae bacterium]
MSGPRYRIAPLTSGHDCKEFTCGAEAPDRYIRTQASQDLRRRIATCFVAVEDGSNVVAGFYTLAATSLVLADLPEDQAKKLPRYPAIPAILLGRLAVSTAAKGQGLGAALLVDAITRTDESGIGAYALVVDAKDDAAKAFYEHFGFMVLPGATLRLAIPMVTALKVIGRQG